MVANPNIGKTKAPGKSPIGEAKRLSRKKPCDRIVDATDDIRDLYQRIRKASREKYLLDREIELLVSKVKVAIGENRAIAGVAS